MHDRGPHHRARRNVRPDGWETDGFHRLWLACTLDMDGMMGWWASFRLIFCTDYTL